LVDKAHPKPSLKELLSKLPEFMQPAAIKQGVVVVLSETGAVTCLPRHRRQRCLCGSVSGASG